MFYVMSTKRLPLSSANASCSVPSYRCKSASELQKLWCKSPTRRPVRSMPMSVGFTLMVEKSK